MRQMKDKGRGWGVEASPTKKRPESNLRQKSPTKKMGHSKTNSMVNRLYTGNNAGKNRHNSPHKTVK